MARYFFHIRDASVVIPDDEGIELRDMHAARIEARQSAVDLGTAQMRLGQGIDRHAIEIADCHGKVLETVPVRSFLN